MKLETSRNGYRLVLTAQETEDWATRPGKRWPCSTLRGRRLVVEVDSNGLVDYLIDGGHDVYLGNDLEPLDPDAHEMEAIVADFTCETEAARFWPCWRWEGATPALRLGNP
jgi:hypothetical protein